METRNCINCKQNFTIEPDDFSFYEKMKVPAPTFCPECRMIRRMCWRNHRSFYRRACAICSKSLLSVYKEDNAPVMCVECWNSDDWDNFKLGKDIDWNRPLFSQINELFEFQPRVFQYRAGGIVINSDYANSVVNSKNIYLSFSVLESEDILFSENVDGGKNSMDCLYDSKIDTCYWNIDSSENYNCKFMLETSKNIDSSFLYDCANCQNCCLSSNLRNKSFVFRNKQLRKEEYNKELEKLSLSTFSGIENAKKEFKEVRKEAISKYSSIINCVNASGEHIYNSKDVKSSFHVFGSENVSDSFRIVSSKDMKDCCWVLTGELEYETISGTNNSSAQIGCAVCFNSSQMEYSIFCRACSNCFGCVGLKNAQYCILNKQYTKEEYADLVPRLRQHMIDIPFIDSKNRVYRYGEFYPYEMSPFGYNETLAHDYFPKTKEIIEQEGFNWKSAELKGYQITIQSKDLPEDIKEVSESILNEVIGCPNNGNYMLQCTTAFKISQEEFVFYKKNELPLPRYCPNCRHYERLRERNPMKLYIRECSNGCGRNFSTTYAPDRPEKVYCEQCYQAEVL